MKWIFGILSVVLTFFLGFCLIKIEVLKRQNQTLILSRQSGVRAFWSCVESGKEVAGAGQVDLEGIPDMWPTQGVVSSEFGYRRHPVQGVNKFHSGVDIANLKTTDIVAPARGRVAYSGKKGGYGITVVIDHGNGFETLFGHASEVLVREGDRVERGTLIARMGSTGVATGDHLHYEVSYFGEKVDPVILTRVR